MRVVPVTRRFLGAAGALPAVEPAPASALTYIKIGLGPEAFLLKPYRMPDGYSLADVVAEIRKSGHLAPVRHAVWRAGAGGDAHSH